jgi:AraC-like DNA-binding protein
MQETGKESLRLWNPHGIQGIEILQAALVKHIFCKHMHEAYTIGINYSGQGSFMCRGETHHAYTGGVNLLNPGEVHTGQAESEMGWGYRAIYFEVPLVKAIVSKLGWSETQLPYFSATIVRDDSVRRLLCQLIGALESCFIDRLELDFLMLGFFAELFSRYSKNKNKATKIGTEKTSVIKAMDYLHDHYKSDISIDELAKFINLSPFYLMRVFQRELGIAPYGYLLNVRLMKAKEALTGIKTIAEVAVENGFYDQSHFTKSFKRVFGVTPGQYKVGSILQYH